MYPGFVEVKTLRHNINDCHERRGLYSSSPETENFGLVDVVGSGLVGLYIKGALTGSNLQSPGIR